MKTKNAVIRARIDSEIKEDAEEVLHKLGLSNSQAINLFYNQIVLHNGLPFSLTLEALDTPDQYRKIEDKKTLSALFDEA